MMATQQSALQVAFKVKTIDQFKRYLKRVNSSQPSSLGKAAALVRKTAKWSIRKRKKISRPGDPPSSHANQLLKRNIFYEVDRRRQNATIGPVALNQRIKGIPETLEHGGKSTIIPWVSKRGSRKERKRKVRMVTVKARPFMGPALEKVRTKLVKYWRGNVK